MSDITTETPWPVMRGIILGFILGILLGAYLGATNPDVQRKFTEDRETQSQGGRAR